MRKAVVLLSGGIDSTVCLALACWGHYDEIHALTFYYGQRHANEIQRAKIIAQLAGVSHHVAMVDSSLWKTVPLCDGRGIPLGRNARAIRDGGIPATFVPGRNLVFLSHGVALAALLGGGDVFLGACAEDARGYPDCRRSFIAAVQDAAREALDGSVHVRVRAPLLTLSKRNVVELGHAMGIDFAQTWSCYRPSMVRDGQPCERCDACVLRMDALAALDQAREKNQERA